MKKNLSFLMKRSPELGFLSFPRLTAFARNVRFASIFLSFFLSFNIVSAQDDVSCISQEVFVQILNNTYGCGGSIDQTIVPELIVKLNIHFVEGVDHSFYPGTGDDTNIWNGNLAIANTLSKLNDDYLPNMLPHPVPEQPAIIGDSKIRFALYSDPDNAADLYNGIWYHATEPSPDDFPYGNNVLNIIVFSERPADQDGINGAAFDSGTADGYIKVYNWGNKLVQIPTENHPYHSARIIMHELGHLTGLCHSFAEDQSCSDVNTFIECGGTAQGGGNVCGGQPINGCIAAGANTNNIMGYGEERRSLTPCQWRIYYGFLYGDTPNYVSVSNSNCSASFVGGDPYIIHTGEHIVFDDLTYMPNDIIIEANASLRVTCRLLMAPKKSITVKRAGKLIVDNAIISNAHEKQWKGIYVEGNGNKEQPNPSFANPNYADPTVAGSVMLNSATILGAQTAVHTRHRTDWWREAYWGGVVAAFNTQFIDNGRAVEFMRYALWDEEAPALIPNKSIFDECLFTGQGEEDNFDSPYGVTIWGCNGIEFTSCIFENLNQTAIYGINCGFRISNSTETGLNQTEFNNIPIGIEVFNTYTNPAYNIIVEQATFESDNFKARHIIIEAASELSNMHIVDCKFYGGLQGIFIDGPAGYIIEYNDFNDMNLPIYTYGTGASPNEIKCNTILSSAGTYDFNLSSDNSGLQVKYNDFTGTTGMGDIYVSGDWQTPGVIGAIQGGLRDPARNCFETAGEGIHIFQGLSEPFEYVVHPDLAPPFEDCILIPENNLTDIGGNWVNNYYLDELIIALPLIKDIDCSHSPSGDTKPDDDPDKDKYNGFKNQLVYYQNFLDNGGVLTAEEEKLFYYLKRDFEQEKKELLAAYQYYAHYDDMEALLLEEDTEQNNRWLLGVYFQAEDWDKAAQLIDILPTTTEDQQTYHDGMVINLAALQQNYIYELSEQEEAALYDMAYSDAPSRAYARSILALLKMAHFEPDEMDWDTQALEIDINTTTQTAPSVRYYPNPSTKTIYINVSAAEMEQGMRYQILDITGREVLLSGTLNAMLNKINLSSLYSGMFILKLEIGESFSETHKLIRL